MGFDYALVHLKFTIPPAILLTFLYRPLITRLDIYKTLFLIAIAVVATTPWDSYLIQRRIWSYPPNVIIGPTVLGIPAEEYFFFVIQTYNTSILYLLLNKPVLSSNYLRGRQDERCPSPYRNARHVGQGIIGVAIAVGAALIYIGREGTYLGMILVWAGPFALLLWTLSYHFLVGFPMSSTVLPIAAPTLYLWVVDTLALQRGTWTIETGTKCNVQLWNGLDIEEAVFFAVTNILIVFGLVAFDNAVAVLLTFPKLFPEIPVWPSPVLLVKALLVPTSKYDMARIAGIQEATSRLQKKSRSFYLASSVFSGRLRIDLIILYSFCRVADDLIDNASAKAEAEQWIAKLRQFLDLTYSLENNSDPKSGQQVQDYIAKTFPQSSQSALTLLPTNILSSSPLYELLDGFQTDMRFHDSIVSESHTFPIKDEAALKEYGSQVAGTIAELCLDLVFHHAISTSGRPQPAAVKNDGRIMGVALQIVNIARDIAVDAAIGRVYVPTDWLKEEGLTPEDVLQNPDHPSMARFRKKLLGVAFATHRLTISAIYQLPTDARGPMRVAIESYMEVGRVLCEEGYKVEHRRATVPKLRRIGVAWSALSKG